jgi:hypothetical protein
MLDNSSSNNKATIIKVNVTNTINLNVNTCIITINAYTTTFA